MIKDLIEEQKREARNRVSGATFNVINDPQTKYWFIKEDLDDFLTEAMTLAYEAGGREERERIISLAGGEPYLYVPEITEANTDTK